MSAGEQHENAQSSGLSPLEGEPGIPSVHAARKGPIAVKAVLAIVVIVVGLIFAVYATITKFVASGDSPSAAEQRKAPKAAATVVGGRVFDPSKPPDLGGVEAPASSTPVVVPAIADNSIEDADPIGVRATSEEQQRRGAKKRSPYDSPAVLGLISATDTRGDVRAEGVDEQQSAEPNDSLRRTQESLDEYQQNLKGMLNNLQRVAASGGNSASNAASGTALQSAAQSTGPLGGQLSTGATARVSAGYLGNRSLTLPKGTTFTCSLKTKVVSEQSGLVGCQVVRNVYSDDQKVLLVSRGAHLDGEYTARIRNGQSRIFVVWTRLLDNGVTVDIGSPATGPLGEAGLEGHVDNHWGQRVGAALLLSVIEGGMEIAAAEAASRGDGTSIVLSDQADTSASLAEKVLDSTINIPPTITKLHAELAAVYVARDVDFSSVYELRTAAR